jgi:inosose dehydratase
MIAGLGINPIGWSNGFLPELGADSTLETCLKDIEWAKYDGVELGGMFPDTADALRPLLETHKLSLIEAIHEGDLLSRTVDEEMALLRDRIDLLCAMDSPVLIYLETGRSIHRDRTAPISTRPTLTAAEWPEYTARLSDLADRVEKEGLALAFHPHIGTAIFTGPEIDRLMAETSPTVGLLMDTAHVKLAGVDPDDLVMKHGERLTHVHAKDLRFEPMINMRENDTSFLDAVLDGLFYVPGSGILNFTALMTALAEIDYGGWLVVEADQDPAKANPRDNATLGRRNLEALSWVSGLI